MRIGINTLFLIPGDVGGTEVFLRNNLREMVGLFPEHTFVLFTALDNEQTLRGDLERFGNVEFRRLPIKVRNRPVRIVAEQLLLPLNAAGAALNIMWSPGYTAPFFCLCPQVVTIHDLQYLSFPEDMTRLERITLDFLVRGACRRCSHILTISRFSKEELIRHGFARAERMSVVYNGVDPGFRPEEDKISETSGVVPSGTPYILCVAHTYPHKKVHHLVEAFGLIQDRIPHHLMVIGKARRGEAEVQQALGRIENRSKIHRFSGLSFSDLVKIYQGADLFVLPSVYEGFGLPVLEAMMARVPVVTTRSASLPEVGGDCVMYVDEVSGPGFASSIMRCLSRSKESRDNICFKAARRAEGFSWRSSAEGIVKVLVSQAK